MACRDEAGGDDHHGHGHGHDHHGHHDHDHDDPERGAETSLFGVIDMPKVRCLNEHEHGAGAAVLKPWSERLDRSRYVDSDADEQLLLHIPFTANITLKSIRIIAEGGDAHPRSLRVFKNRDDIDFDNVEDMEPLQQWDLHEDPEGRIEYQTKISRFQGLHSLTLFFPDNNGADETRIYYIGLHGEFQRVVRDTIITIAEVAARPEDHKNDASTETSFHSQQIS